MAKSKRSKHMRAMRKILRDKLSKKDEAKRLALMKNDDLLLKKKPIQETPLVEDMQVSGNTNSTAEYNIRTLKNKEGHYPSWLSGRQRKRLQAKQAVVKRIEKNKKAKKTSKGKKPQKKVVSDKPEAMLA